MLEMIKDFIKDMMDLEKQYSILIFFTVLLISKIFSGGAFESFISNITNLCPKVLNTIFNLFSCEFIYNFTNFLIVFNSVNVIIFGLTILIQLICKEKFKINISTNGTQYTSDLFLGRFAITSVNLYVLIWILVNTFSCNKIHLCFSQNPIYILSFFISSLTSASILVGLFINGKPQKNSNR